MLDDLVQARDLLQESSQIASRRLREIWNPDTRQYEPHEEMVALHAIINQNLRVWFRINSAIRELESAVV